MKLHFEGNLDYQLAAIEAVCDLFRGQEQCRTEFTVTMPGDPASLFDTDSSDLGIGNRLQLLDTDLLKNLRDVQLRHGLKPSEELKQDDFNFTVEMETGTGKTYVYLRTIFELNRRYGFTKFVIVVPSVAIKEGVYKSLEITADHLRALYGNVPFSKGNNYFLYDSSKLGQVRNFATSPQIQVMVVTVGAINKKDVNNLYKQSEKVNDEKPIDLIRATRPIVIVDEPQSVDGGLQGEGKAALERMRPLCTLRYSATTSTSTTWSTGSTLWTPTSKKLVKQIEVASLEVEGGHNKAYARLVSVKSTRGKITAKLELDVQQGAGVVRKEVTVQDGDDLEQTTGRAVYANCRVGEIRTAKGPS
ncbi:DEAD/DEAH box helicase family protein [Gemmata sp. G18]|uniref:DEAD/DEAH box helicase family protein n=1 Tax=Gemmata palustris TaxID=2822762 RepID=A0ABS5BMW0_9BACT|nr:DEAD/DEAH box helicase family protein [Gemmata palustris]MBP3955051.1 DEAD/DEAH box helicase family protein [Gemmata palustris]